MHRTYQVCGKRTVKHNKVAFGLQEKLENIKPILKCKNLSYYRITEPVQFSSPSQRHHFSDEVKVILIQIKKHFLALIMHVCYKNLNN